MDDERGDKESLKFAQKIPCLNTKPAEAGIELDLPFGQIPNCHSREILASIVFKSKSPHVDNHFALWRWRGTIPQIPSDSWDF